MENNAISRLLAKIATAQQRAGWPLAAFNQETFAKQLKTGQMYFISLLEPWKRTDGIIKPVSFRHGARPWSCMRDISELLKAIAALGISIRYRIGVSVVPLICQHPAASTQDRARLNNLARCDESTYLRCLLQNGIFAGKLQLREYESNFLQRLASNNTQVSWSQLYDWYHETLLWQLSRDYSDFNLIDLACPNATQASRLYSQLQRIMPGSSLLRPTKNAGNWEALAEDRLVLFDDD